MSACRNEIRAWGQPLVIRHASVLPSTASTSFVETSPPIWLNVKQGPRSITSSELHAFNIDQFQSLGCFDGLLSHSFVCLECGHTFDRQLNPFTSLMLPIPNVRMNGEGFTVDDDLSVKACLRDFFANRRQGPIQCPKCSFLCTLTGEMGTDFVRDSNCWGSSYQMERRSSLDEEINNYSRRSSGLSDLLMTEKENRSPMGGVVYRSRASFDLKEFSNNSFKPVTPGSKTKHTVLKEIIKSAQASPLHDARFHFLSKRLKHVGIDWIRSESHVCAQTAIGKCPKVKQTLSKPLFGSILGLGHCFTKKSVRWYCLS